MSQRDQPTVRPESPPEAAGTSMVSPQEKPTDAAPPYMPPVAHAPAPDKHGPPPIFAPGRRIHDFEIQRLLGSGAFAHVYLARQVSLERLVALKVSADQGTEARTLAHLEHDHIVQVFTEIPDPAVNLRYLCMQFVPGLTLDRIIVNLSQRDPATWNGHAFLDNIDLLCTEQTSFDLAGFNDRTMLQRFDHAEVACWMGARLAQALAHAHNKGVIHRDIKPANILVNRYGRPFLADFNIALNSSQPAGTGDETFGGTLAYMAPEHIDAFNPASGVAPQAVDARSDIYSLGLVLFVFLTGQSPFRGKLKGNVTEALFNLAAERRAKAPSPRQISPMVPELLDRLVRRCLDPEPARRFSSAADLTCSLEGCREMQQVEKAAGQDSWRVRWAKKRPFTMLLVLALIPQVIGTAVNITYNQLHIVADLSQAQRDFFPLLVICFNAVIWPTLVPILALLVRRVWQGCRQVAQEINLPAESAARIRRQAMKLPFWTVFLSAVGWFPGAVVFPYWLEGRGAPTATGHADLYLPFTVSFVLSGLIASTYSYFAVWFVVLRVLYPQLWSDPAEARQQARRELPGVTWYLRFYQFLAGLIPVGGAALLIFAAPDRLTVSYRFLILTLLVAGIAGFGLATMVTNRLEQVIALLIGGRRDKGPK
jgi:serine/threonine protein kinase